MDSSVPLLHCVLQHTLRRLCSPSHSSKWVYAVFWRILPRNYPPPKWEFGGSTLDLSRGNKRNWILVWEDGFCDFYECQRAERFGADIFFRMSHEVYCYGEGLVGKVASDYSHKWIFRDTENENDPSFISSWNVSIEPQPGAWVSQFKSGIQTIAIISVKEGIVQLGSFDKILEDLNLVFTIQRKFSYLQSIPGLFSTQRPYSPIQCPYIPKSDIEVSKTQEIAFSVENRPQLVGIKRFLDERQDITSIKSMNLGWNTPQNGIMLSIPPLLPSMSYSLGALLSKLPPVLPSDNVRGIAEKTFIANNVDNSRLWQKLELNDDSDEAIIESQVADIKVEPSCLLNGPRE